jgi:hypothetical protein
MQSAMLGTQLSSRLGPIVYLFGHVICMCFNASFVVFGGYASNDILSTAE